MKNKKIACLALSLVFLLGTGGIYAASQEAINEVDTGVVNIEIDEYTLDKDGKEIPWVDEVSVTPGKKINKIPYFTATGNDCYIRATIEIDEDIDTGHPIEIEDFEGISDDWVRAGDYFYYKKILKTNESVDFFHSFNVPAEWGDSINPANIGDWGFRINVTVDAVQSDNFAPNFKSESPWGDIVIQESIHKDGYDVNVFTTNQETSMSIIIEDHDNIIVEPEDFFEGFKTMVPGDVLTDSVEIKSKEHCNLYFSTESLEDIDLLENMLLEIVLIKDGEEKVVYDGILDSRIDDLLLGEFDKNEKAELRFTVKMPEELDNEYTLRNGKVKWMFRSEIIEEPGSVQTGDEAPITAFVTLMVASGLAVVVLLLKKKKNA